MEQKTSQEKLQQFLVKLQELENTQIKSIKGNNIIKEARQTKSVD